MTNKQKLKYDTVNLVSKYYNLTTLNSLVCPIVSINKTCKIKIKGGFFIDSNFLLNRYANCYLTWNNIGLWDCKGKLEKLLKVFSVSHHKKV